MPDVAQPDRARRWREAGENFARRVVAHRRPRRWEGGEARNRRAGAARSEASAPAIPPPDATPLPAAPRRMSAVYSIGVQFAPTSRRSALATAAAKMPSPTVNGIRMAMIMLSCIPNGAPAPQAACATSFLPSVPRPFSAPRTCAPRRVLPSIKRTDGAPSAAVERARPGIDKLRVRCARTAPPSGHRSASYACGQTRPLVAWNLAAA